MGGILINAGVINYGGLPSGGSGLLAARPAAGVVGRIYIASDSALLYRDTGSAWVTIGGSGPSGSGASGQGTFWTGASTISGDNAFFWDNTNKRLGLGTITPGVRLDIHGTGVIQQINGTTTNNAYLDFQNAGSTQWRLGNFYNGAVQQFAIYNAAGASNVLTILQAGNIGVNTLSPQSNIKLDVRGDSGVSGGVGVSGIAYNGAGGIGVNGTGFATALTGICYGIFGQSTGVRGGGATNIGGYFEASGGTNNYALVTGLGNVGFGYSTPAINGVAAAGSVYQGSNVANSNFQMLCAGNFYTGGFSPNFYTYTSNITIAVGSNLNTGYVFKTAATITVNLPTANGLNNMFYFVVLTGTTVTVNRAGSDVILNTAGTSVTSLTLVGYTKIMLYCDGGTTWYQLF
jgi:hypothetical protein